METKKTPDEGSYLYLAAGCENKQLFLNLNSQHVSMLCLQPVVFPEKEKNPKTIITGLNKMYLMFYFHSERSANNVTGESDPGCLQC